MLMDLPRPHSRDSAHPGFLAGKIGFGCLDVRVIDAMEPRRYSLRAERLSQVRPLQRVDTPVKRQISDPDLGHPKTLISDHTKPCTDSFGFGERVKHVDSRI